MHSVILVLSVLVISVSFKHQNNMDRTLQKNRPQYKKPVTSGPADMMELEIKVTDSLQVSMATNSSPFSVSSYFL